MSDITNKSIYSYEPPESLWQLIKENVYESELDAIKSAIGESLVDTSIELHSEIDTLLDIWRDYRHETECNNDQIIRNNSNKNILPEPPDQRQRLIKEINLFVKQMREKYDDKLFSKQLVSNNHNLNVINYALNKVSDGSEFGGDSGFSSSSPSCFTPKLTDRPMSSMSKSGKETPCTTFRARNNCSVLSTTLECVEDKLNCMQIDDIVDRLRETLQEEIDILLKDVDFIHECLDKESEYRRQSKINIKEPTLNELKEERTRLEEHILTSNNTAALHQRPISGQSNHSLSSINISLKSPSPSPAPTPPLSASSSRYQPESPQISFRNKVPLTLTNLTKAGVHSTTTTTTTKKPLTTSTTSTNGNVIHKSTPHTHNNSIRTTTTMGLTASNNTNTIQQPQIKTGALASKRIDNRSIDNLPNATASSASLRSTSVSSTARSKVVVPSAAKPSSAEKFRKMVLESRDSP